MTLSCTPSLAPPKINTTLTKNRNPLQTLSYPILSTVDTP
jgi:hypothetical protein